MGNDMYYFRTQSETPQVNNNSLPSTPVFIASAPVISTTVVNEEMTEQAAGVTI